MSDGWYADHVSPGSIPCPCQRRCQPLKVGVLGIVYRVIATHRIKKAGHTHATVCTGAVTLIQRFGSALNLNMPQGTFS